MKNYIKSLLQDEEATLYYYRERISEKLQVDTYEFTYGDQFDVWHVKLVYVNKKLYEVEGYIKYRLLEKLTREIHL